MKTQPVAFYHVAGLGHWRDIVSEQLGLLGRSGFPGKVHCGFIGGPWEDGHIAHVAKAAGLDCEIRHFGGDMHQYEFPTQRWMHEVAGTLPPETPMLYFHGKSVSKTSWPWIMWRWLMNAYCLAGWRQSIEAIDEYNCAGVSWSMHPSMPAPHFPGTFWWASAGFVSHLTPVDEYVQQFEAWRKHHPASFIGTRHAAEAWFNSRVDADPRVWGPPASRFWDPKWWTAPENKEWCRVAYQIGSGIPLTRKNPTGGLRMATSFDRDYPGGWEFYRGASAIYPEWCRFSIKPSGGGDFVIPLEETLGGIAQHGAFLDHWPDLSDDDVILFTDCDAVLQRPFTDEELAEMQVAPGEFAAALNQNDENATLFDEAKLLVPEVPEKELDTEFPGWRTTPIRNVGFLVGRAGDWKALYAEATRSIPRLRELLPHRVAIQWLMCYLIGKHFRLKTLPRTIHAHGHFGPSGATRDDDGNWCLDGQVIAFAHHFG